MKYKIYHKTMFKNAQFLLLFLVPVLLISCEKKTDVQPLAVVFTEPEAPQEIPHQNWESVGNNFKVSWVSSNKRYHKAHIPDLKVSKKQLLKAWKGERVNAQIAIWAKDSVENIQVEVKGLKSKNSSISTENISTYFVRNVLSDSFLGGCGYKTKSDETAQLVPDCLEEVPAFTMSSKSTRTIWLTIDIPKNAMHGSYTGELFIKAKNQRTVVLNLNIEVLNKLLPQPEEWTFHLDLWQNPFAVARFHNLELWSEAHFAKMKPLYEILANSGQKCITTSVVDKPWGGQTLDPFQSMIGKTLKKNGSWEYDFGIFDKWVTFMMDLGIDRQINCYSLIPWGNKLEYFDEKSGEVIEFVAKANSSEFEQYWVPFLEEFSRHLKEKNWHDITTIAMDERPTRDMKKAIALIQKHAGLKITSAANYNPGTADDIYDLSVESKHLLPDTVLEKRKKNGQKTTYYVCCSAEYPNNFTYSPPAEGIWQGWYAFAQNQDGFLRWAYNSWVEDPLSDTRFRTWPAGDTFFIYPGPKSSIRFEKLREGIQDFEKLKIRMNELKNAEDQESKELLQQFKSVLSEFEIEILEEEGPLKAINKGRFLLNQSF